MDLMIVPMWHTQSWFPRLLNCLNYPVVLPFHRDLLRLSHNNEFHVMNKRKLFLVVCCVSGNPSRIRELQNLLEKSSICITHGDPPHQNNMNFSGKNSVFGVLNGKLILSNQLRYN